MKLRSICALACAVTMLPFGAIASAETPQEQTTQFRTVAPQTFSATELQAYGLNAGEAQRAVDLQEQGYTIVALTPEEAEAYRAGTISTQEWILIGIGVLIILAIA